ncbi:hypothetical protein RD792_012053 [Penstemon davidsonii]|uniref:LysM domain-containing protein n=1 Tax=Penstemon davidsonii TaxID=160366 RepID=A0ABR0CW71_9LAMI|nr:hypothetical protein RD792_012053 [Penstemon davidsonii]
MSQMSSSMALAEAISWYASLLLALMFILNISCCEPSERGDLLEFTMNTDHNDHHVVFEERPCDEIYVVKEGETLHTISDKCGDPYIVEENPHIHDPDDVFPGLVIKITPFSNRIGPDQTTNFRSSNVLPSPQTPSYSNISVMEQFSNLFIFSYLFLLLITAGEASRSTKPMKIFVFGDSYADTGNVRNGSSWKEPYGITFPGKPAGRFSDGHVYTDYFAKLLGVRSPIPYRAWMKYLGGKKLYESGINFAYGGSGVFDTYSNVIVPNMTTQIDFFEKLIKESHVITKTDLQSSVVHVSLAGNDYGMYGVYTAKGGTPQGIKSFIPFVINQLELNLRRIREIGVSKITVTGLEPLGCFPLVTQFSSFKQCNATLNLIPNYHNHLLHQVVAKLNNENSHSKIFILDLYNSFTNVINHKGAHDAQGQLKFETPLKPCCMGIRSGLDCGDVDANGTKMYTVCSDPKSSFFWDMVHPTNVGWRAVFINLKSSLKQFFEF